MANQIIVCHPLLLLFVHLEVPVFVSSTNFKLLFMFFLFFSFLFTPQKNCVIFVKENDIIIKLLL